MRFTFPFLREKQAVVGLAFGNGHARAVQLSGHANAATLQAYSEAALPKTAFGADGLVDVEAIAHTLENMFLKPTYGVFTARDVAVNMPDARCFLRVIHMAQASDEELSAGVPFEAESYIPIPIDQVYLDWQRLEDMDDRATLLLAASPKTFVDDVLAGVTRAGLTPVAVEAESLSISRAVLGREAIGTVLIANIRSQVTDFISTEKGQVQFTSTVPFAGTAIRETIQKGLEVSADRAEEIRLSAGCTNTQEYPNMRSILLPILSSFVSEVRKVLVFHEQHGGQPITEILLVGSGGALRGLAEYVQSELVSTYPNVRVAQADPTRNIHMLKSEQFSGPFLLAYAGAFGLALRSLV